MRFESQKKNALCYSQALGCTLQFFNSITIASNIKFHCHVAWVFLNIIRDAGQYAIKAMPGGDFCNRQQSQAFAFERDILALNLVSRNLYSV
ncbi:hypothetical protein D3C87_1508840 [compost metagenome]